MTVASTPLLTRRAELLARLARPHHYDLAIVGGGATGLGVALDAAARGLSVVLVESHDFAKGTSSRSTKLVHGGVRYLAQGNIGLVREALHERTTLLANAPHLAQDLPFVMRPISEGGQLHHKGQVEVASSLEKDGRAIPYEIRKGVWVVFEAATDYQKNCFEEYMLCTDPSGRYSVMYKRWHLIGLEVGMSVASIGLRKEPTGCPIGFHADVIATAKRDLKPGEMLDGEGGYTVYGKLFPSEKSTTLGSLPLGLAHNVKLLKPIKAGQSLTYADVAMDETLTAVKIRREMERDFAPAAARIAAQ